MAKGIVTLPQTLTQADWSMTINAIHAMMIACGWVQTADTGQVNLASILANTAYYEIWTPGDALQATSPFFLRIDYRGEITHSWAYPTFTIGTSTNGAGTIYGGATSTPCPLAAQIGTVATTGALYDCWYFGDTSSVTLLLWRNGQVAQTLLLSVERSRNASGAYTGDYFTQTSFVGGYYWSWNTAALGFIQQSVFSSALAYGAAPQTCLIPAIPIWGPSSGFFANNLAISPAYPFIGKIDYPALNLAFAFVGDVTEGGVAKMNLYGVDHTYLFTKVFSAVTQMPGKLLATGIRWE